jgi:hypothetical protein
MHKTNILLISIALAIPVTAAVTWLPFIHRSEWLGIFYFPAILLSVALSGHSPGTASVWTSSIAYTLLYLCVIVIVYALLLEIYVLRSALSRIAKNVDVEAASETLDARRVFESVGQGLQDVETRRRKHWVLAARPYADLSEPHVVQGAKPFAVGPRDRVEKAFIHALYAKLKRQLGEAVATQTMQRFEEQAAQVTEPVAATDSR